MSSVLGRLSPSNPEHSTRPKTVLEWIGGLKHIREKKHTAFFPTENMGQIYLFIHVFLKHLMA